MRIFLILLLVVAAASCSGEPDPCRRVDCAGHGTCRVEGGRTVCACEPGYHAVGLVCVEGDPLVVPPPPKPPPATSDGGAIVEKAVCDERLLATYRPSSGKFVYTRPVYDVPEGSQTFRANCHGHETDRACEARVVAMFTRTVSTAGWSIRPRLKRKPGGRPGSRQVEITYGPQGEAKAGKLECYRFLWRPGEGNRERAIELVEDEIRAKGMTLVRQEDKGRSGVEFRIRCP